VRKAEPAAFDADSLKPSSSAACGGLSCGSEAPRTARSPKNFMSMSTRSTGHHIQAERPSLRETAVAEATQLRVYQSLEISTPVVDRSVAAPLHGDSDSWPAERWVLPSYVEIVSLSEGRATS